MKQMIKGQATVPDTLRTLYVPIAQELEQVENLLHDELRSDHPFVDQLVKHGFRLGGKRLRPALLLLAGKACGNLQQEHFVLGAVVELIHTATLIHDDVLDEATIRRHLDTVNARWDNEASVLLGDYLFARSICLASTLEDFFATRVLSATARIMCEGELRQIENRGNYNLGEDQYLSIIGNKTAELIACSCRLGAYYAGANDESLEALRRYGYNLGMAFQIADDLLDLLGDENTVGKSLGTDLLKQKATLPLIRLLDQVSTERTKRTDRRTIGLGQPSTWRCCEIGSSSPMQFLTPGTKQFRMPKFGRRGTSRTATQLRHWTACRELRSLWSIGSCNRCSQFTS